MNYKEIGTAVGSLVTEKNKAYGNSIANSVAIMNILYPNGIAVEQYTDVLAMVRVLDKLSRIAASKNAFGESPWEDIAGYSILMLGENNVTH